MKPLQLALCSIILLFCLACIFSQSPRDAGADAAQDVVAADATDVAPDGADAADTSDAADAGDSSDAMDALDARDAALDARDAADAADGACLSDATACATGCTDLSADRLNCGACGHRCVEFEACVAGVCQLDCVGTTLCAPTLCRDLTRDNQNCGACGSACPAVANGRVTCRASACVAACDPGFALSAGACVAAAGPSAPRLVAPLSGSTASSQRPTLRWQQAAGTTGARVELCADRACASVVQSFDAAGASGRPPAALAAGLYFWRALGLSGGAPSTGPSATWQLRVRSRSAALDTAWGAEADFNGDGYGDAITSSVMNARAYAYHGGPAGLGTTPATTLAPLLGSTYFGHVAQVAGDVNGDGYTDAIVSELPGTPARYQVFHGGVAGLATTPATTLAFPVGDGSSTAWVPQAMGDLNGDGYGDVMVGGSGIVRVYYGSAAGLATEPGLTLFGPAPGPMMFGWPPAGAYGTASAVGDVNGDGYADAVVQNDTTLEVHQGGPGGLRTTPDAVIARRPMWLAPAGDVNGDGYADLVVAAWETTSSYYVYLGGAAGLALTPATAITVPSVSPFTERCDGVGDVDGDGYDDVLIARPVSSDATAWLHLGSPAGLTALPARSYPPPTGARYFGQGTTALGDVQRDGLLDFAVVSTGTGAYIFHGAAGNPPAAASRSLTPPAGSTGFPSWMD